MDGRLKWRLLSLVVFHVVALVTAEEKVSDEQTWACAPGWLKYTEGPNVTCIYLSEELVEFYDQENLCQRKYDAATIKITTKDKSDFIKDLVAVKGKNYWLYLYKKRNYREPFRWLLDSSKMVDVFESSESKAHYYSSRYAYIGPSGWRAQKFRGSYHAICEKDACKDWFENLDYVDRRGHR